MAVVQRADLNIPVAEDRAGGVIGRRQVEVDGELTLGAMQHLPHALPHLQVGDKEIDAPVADASRGVFSRPLSLRISHSKLARPPTWSMWVCEMKIARTDSRSIPSRWAVKEQPAPASNQ